MAVGARAVAPPCTGCGWGVHGGGGGGDGGAARVEAKGGGRGPSATQPVSTSTSMYQYVPCPGARVPYALPTRPTDRLTLTGPPFSHARALFQALEWRIDSSDLTHQQARASDPALPHPAYRTSVEGVSMHVGANAIAPL